jgi:flagellar biosynthetic protein FliR
MLSVTDVQLNAWLAALLYPLARILGLVASAPLFNNPAIPLRIKLATGLAIALALAPVLPAQPDIAPASWAGLLILVQQSLIGIALGFTVRIVFAAVDLAGELIGLQMGLGFAVFYDPLNGAQLPIIAELAGLLTLLIFLAMNGHLAVLGLLAQSFSILPAGGALLPAAGWGAIVRWGALLFSAGVLLSLPLIAALLITNIALGILNRAAPQLNLFAVGFPITLIAGFAVLALTLPHLPPTLERLFGQGFEAIGSVLTARQHTAERAR